ncbi:MPPV-282 hypothetical protein [Magpiepox virus 2]|nr:hypothetical protein [Magpiepox virus]QZW33605.1 MPPV-282 hypothetical protein [Magpiepox virus 2]
MYIHFNISMWIYILLVYNTYFTSCTNFEIYKYHKYILNGYSKRS